MKLRIDKAGDKIKIELTTDSSKKPIVLDLTQAQLDNALKTLDMVRTVPTITFAIEV